MKTTHLFFVLAAGIFSSLVACQKGDNLFPDEAKPVSAADIHARYAPGLQSFQGDAASGFSIRGEKGVEITFPANAFMYPDGQPVTGQVTVRLKEYLTKADIVFGGMPTESNGWLLETGGEIYVDAFAGSSPLRLNPANGPLSADPVEVVVPRNPDQDPDGMILFVEGNREGRPDTAANGGAWTPPVPEPDPNVTWQAAAYYPFGNSPNTYWFNLPDFGWSNCDRLYNYPGNRVSASVKPDEAAPAGMTDVQALLIFRDIESVITLVPAPGRFDSYINSLPEGAVATAVLLGKNAAGNFMLGYQTITIAANAEYVLLPEEVTQAQVDAFIAGIQ